MGILALGWKLDYRRFYIYLTERYHVSRVYIFIGYLESNKKLYKFLSRLGYNIVFRKISFGHLKKIKGNVDIDLTVKALVEIDRYNKAIIITSDGDFYPLILELVKREKFLCVMSPNRKSCSRLLKISASEKIIYLDELRKNKNGDFILSTIT